MILANNRLNAACEFHQQGDLDTAETIYRTVIRDFPKKTEAWVYLGISLNDQGRFEEALAAYERALRLSPGSTSALTNSGLTLAMLGQHEKALENHKKAIEIDPEFARGHTNLGIQQLRMGNTEAGWRNYQWRTKTAIFSPPSCTAPFWKGEDLLNKHLLIHGEQGLGDEVQTARYVRDVTKLAGTVTLSADRKLVPLFRRSLQNCTIVERGSKLPSVDYQICSFSLPQHFGVGFTGAYLQGDPLDQTDWLTAMTQLPGLKIGLNWTGNVQNPMNALRTFPLRGLIEYLPGEISLVSLQAVHGTAALSKLSDPVQIHQPLVSKGGDKPRSIDEMASVIRGLDLVITCDSLCAHLAAALGVETWLLLAKVPDWRWGLSSNSSEWYDHIKLYRQKTRGQWSEVFARIGKDVSTRPNHK